MRRVQSGQAGNAMMGGLNQLGPQRATAEFGDWTTRIAHGELPAQAPPRPQGVERNVVITQWDWADPKAYLHDEISTDKRNPTVNANGLIYGSPEESRDYLPVLDPVHNTISQVKIPYRDPNTPGQPKPLQPSPVWGDEAIWDSHTTVHNPMFDQRGRLWYTRASVPADNPAFCKAGSSLPSAKLTPVDRSGRQLAVYDPATKQTSMIDTCFGTHHLLFAEDANNTLWTSSGGGGGVVGWLNTKMWDQTHDEQKSQGWTALVLDTNGNGKRDAYVEAEQKVVTAPSGESLGTSSALNATADPTKDTRLNAAFYGLAIGTDGMIWGSVLGFPGGIVRLNPGSNPPETALAEYYEVPWNNPKAPVWGFSPRGMDIDRNDVAWVALGSGHLASFDRRKCKGPLNGPKATGQHCPEGWTLYPTPGPNFKNVKDSGSADSHYYDWVDQFDTLGAGQEHAHRHRQLVRFADRSGEREVRGPARAVSAGLLRERDGRPHRRSEGRLERQRSLDHLGHAHAVPQRDRKRNDQQGGALPNSARSARELETRQLFSTDRPAKSRKLQAALLRLVVR